MCTASMYGLKEDALIEQQRQELQTSMREYYIEEQMQHRDWRGEDDRCRPIFKTTYAVQKCIQA